MSDVRQRVVAILNETCSPSLAGEIDDDTSLFDLGLDSLDFSSLLIAIEDAFGVEFGDDDFEKVRSISALCRYLESCRG
jgi:acyl carrier protein